MLTVSCYAVHSFVARFLALWKWAQMISDWVTFFLSMLCCSCLDGIPAFSNSSDSNSCYKFFSDHSAILEAGEANKRQIPYSDTEVQLRNHNTQETSQEDLEITDSGDITCGPNIYLGKACGEPRVQQLVVDFSPEAGDGEIELRNQIYDDQCSSSMDVTSESEPGLVQARGDHMKRAGYRGRRYANSSETEVVLKTHYPEYESSTTSQARDTSSANDTAIYHQKLYPRGQYQSSPDLEAVNQSIVSTVEMVNQHSSKDSSDTDNETITSTDHIWEFQSCFSTPMAVFRQTDPQCKTFNSDKYSTQNNSEVELKSHVYSAFRTSSVEDMVFVQKTVEQNILMKVPKSVLKVTRTPENDVNLPTVHKTKKKGTGKVPESVVCNIADEITTI
ncbi:hypothetical protein O0L34_g4739 [Tuta absoluta]|nr:hypothetical protein O0L34_g4739 [Tuta absoluta]